MKIFVRWLGYLAKSRYEKGEMKNRRKFVKGSTTDFSSQSQRQRGNDTLVSSDPTRWRAYRGTNVSACSKVNDTQSRNGRVITRLAFFDHVNFCALSVPIWVVHFVSLSHPLFLALFTDYIFKARCFSSRVCCCIVLFV